MPDPATTTRSPLAAANQRTANLLLQKKLATQEQIKAAIAAQGRVQAEKKPPLLAVLVGQKVLTKEVAQQVGAELAKARQTATAAAAAPKPAEEKKPSDGLDLDFMDDEPAPSSAPPMHGMPAGGPPSRGGPPSHGGPGGPMGGPRLHGAPDAETLKGRELGLKPKANPVVLVAMAVVLLGVIGAVIAVIAGGSGNKDDANNNVAVTNGATNGATNAGTNPNTTPNQPANTVNNQASGTNTENNTNGAGTNASNTGNNAPVNNAVNGAGNANNGGTSPSESDALTGHLTNLFAASSDELMNQFIGKIHTNRAEDWSDQVFDALLTHRPPPVGPEDNAPSNVSEPWGRLLQIVTARAQERNVTPEFLEGYKPVLASYIEHYPSYVATSLNQLYMADGLLIVADFLTTNDEGCNAHYATARKNARTVIVDQLRRATDKEAATVALVNALEVADDEMWRRIIGALVDVNPYEATLHAGRRFREFERGPIYDSCYQAITRAARADADGSTRALAITAFEDEDNPHYPSVEVALNTNPLAAKPLVMQYIRHPASDDERLYRRLIGTVARRMPNEQLAFLREWIADKAVVARYRLYALNQLIVKAKIDPSTTEDLIQTVLTILEDPNEIFNPHEALAGLCDGRKDLLPRFKKIAQDRTRPDLAELVVRMWECDPAPALDEAFAIIDDAKVDSRHKAAMLPWLVDVCPLDDARLDRVIANYNKNIENLGPELQGALRSCTTKRGLAVTSGMGSIEYVGAVTGLVTPARAADSYITWHPKAEYVAYCMGDGDRIGIYDLKRKVKIYGNRRVEREAWARWEAAKLAAEQAQPPQPFDDPEPTEGVTPMIGRLGMLVYAGDDLMFITQDWGLETWKWNKDRTGYTCVATQQLDLTGTRLQDAQLVPTDATLAWNEKSKQLALVFNNTLVVLKLGGGLEGWAENIGSISKIEIDPGGKYVAVSSERQGVRLIEIKKNATPVAVRDKPAAGHQMLFGDRGKQLWIPFGNDLEVYDVKTGQTAEEAPRLSPAFTVDRDYLGLLLDKDKLYAEFAYERQNAQTRIAVRKIDTGEFIANFTVACRMVTLLPCSDGSTFAIWGDDGKLYFYSAD